MVQRPICHDTMWPPGMDWMRIEVWEVSAARRMTVECGPMLVT